jgi:hypothetical protein
MPIHYVEKQYDISPLALPTQTPLVPQNSVPPQLNNLKMYSFLLIYKI